MRKWYKNIFYPQIRRNGKISRYLWDDTSDSFAKVTLPRARRCSSYHRSPQTSLLPISSVWRRYRPKHFPLARDTRRFHSPVLLCMSSLVLPFWTIEPNVNVANLARRLLKRLERKRKLRETDGSERLHSFLFAHVESRKTDRMFCLCKARFSSFRDAPFRFVFSVTHQL